MDDQQDNQGRPADAGAAETSSVAAQAGNERPDAVPDGMVLGKEGV
jgi:hypothetical protein